ncbi:hypothetical protein GCM10020256_24260 [Streptomyces thermocoprophilus]
MGAFGVGVLAEADRVEDVAFGEDADAAGVRVVHHRRAHLAGGHQGGCLAESVTGGPMVRTTVLMASRTSMS